MILQCDQFSSSHADDANHKWRERARRRSMYIDLDSLSGEETLRWNYDNEVKGALRDENNDFAPSLINIGRARNC